MSNFHPYFIIGCTPPSLILLKSGYSVPFPSVTHTSMEICPILATTLKPFGSCSLALKKFLLLIGIKQLLPELIEGFFPISPIPGPCCLHLLFDPFNFLPAVQIPRFTPSRKGHSTLLNLPTDSKAFRPHLIFTPCLWDDIVIGRFILNMYHPSVFELFTPFYTCRNSVQSLFYLARLFT